MDGTTGPIDLEDSSEDNYESERLSRWITNNINVVIEAMEEVDVIKTT